MGIASRHSSVLRTSLFRAQQQNGIKCKSERDFYSIQNSCIPHLCASHTPSTFKQGVNSNLNISFTYYKCFSIYTDYSCFYTLFSNHKITHNMSFDLFTESKMRVCKRDHAKQTMFALFRNGLVDFDNFLGTWEERKFCKTPAVETCSCVKEKPATCFMSMRHASSFRSLLSLTIHIIFLSVIFQCNNRRRNFIVIHTHGHMIYIYIYGQVNIYDQRNINKLSEMESSTGSVWLR